MKVIITPYRQYLNYCGINYLTPQRLNRLYKYRRAEDRARCLAAGLLMRRYAGITDEPLYGTYGKPYKQGAMHFNVSHGGEYVALAVSDNEIGVDTERCQDFCADIAGMCFTPRERAWIFGARNIRRAFFRLWTLKESVMKLFGCGLSMAPESFELWAPDARRHVVRERGVYLFSCEFDSHILATACFEPYGESEIIFVGAEKVLYEIENSNNADY